MSQKLLPNIIFVVVALILAGIITIAFNSKSNAPAPTAGTYTLADIGKHATAQNCWTTINGSVYNVTSWIDQHPGGAQAIIGMCGIDASDAFNGQHGGQRRPASELDNFKIGTLI